ncbi:conserved hypothetical protein [Neospora caninum Liverpool]|uniref:Uncharacterized protein n=1 Tax=Neospora caninum (strain Liverpool) TaxID=572307 RepID=F0VGW9_NEOCL|nr:conserved hypothetical protein [Neospora caninum Liverpool]CBZ52963.1 conserved hypothetical protein [Neospora caninum Liverpool]CEL66948.1 TPA: hypothetical protein BN1204_027520 [Neospora caninum Liverpool]|eukprot:XP_003882995.1 conserved hypothetical protein [Neospora caninum Liverpool]
MDSTSTLHRPFLPSLASDSHALLSPFPSSSAYPRQSVSLSQVPLSRNNPVAHAAASSSCAAASQYAVFSEAAAGASELARQLAVADESDGALENKLRGVGAWAGGCTYTQATDFRSYEENRHAFSLGQVFPEVVPLPPVLQRLLHRKKPLEVSGERCERQTQEERVGEPSFSASLASAFSPRSSCPSPAQSGVFPLLQLLWVAEGATLHLWPLPVGSPFSSPFATGFACERDEDAGDFQARQKRAHSRRLVEQQKLLHSTLTYELPSPISCLQHVLLPRSLLPLSFASSFLFFSPSRGWRHLSDSGGQLSRREDEGDSRDDLGEDDCFSSSPDPTETTHFHALVAVSSSSVSILALGSQPSLSEADRRSYTRRGLSSSSSFPSSLQLYQVASLPLSATAASPFATLFSSADALEITAVGVHHGSSRIFLGDKDGGLYELRLLPLSAGTSALGNGAARQGRVSLAVGAESARLGVRKIRRRDTFAEARGSERERGRQGRGEAETEEDVHAFSSEEDEDDQGAGEDGDEAGLFQCRLERLGASLISRILRGASEVVSSAFAFLPSRRVRGRGREDRQRRAFSAAPPVQRGLDRFEEITGGERILSITADEARGALWALNAASDVTLLLLDPPALSPDGTLVEAHPPVSVVRLKRREMERQIGADFRNWAAPPVPFCGEPHCPQCVSSSRFSFRSPQTPLWGGASGKGLFGFFGSNQELRVVSAHPTAPHEAQTIAVVLLDERGGRIYLQLENFCLVSRLMGEPESDAQAPSSYPSSASSAPFLRVAWYRPAPAAAGYCCASPTLSRSGDSAFGAPQGPKDAAPGALCGARHRKLKLGYYAQGAAVLLFAAEDGEKGKASRREGDGRDRAASEGQVSPPAFERLVAIAPELEVSAREAAPSTSSWCHLSSGQKQQPSSFYNSAASRRVHPLKEAFAAFPLCTFPLFSSASFTSGESLWVGEVPCLGEGAAHALSEKAAFTLPSPFDIAKRIHWRYLPYRDVLSAPGGCYSPSSPRARGSRGGAAYSHSRSGPNGFSPASGSFVSASPLAARSGSHASANPSEAPAPGTNPLFASVEKTIAVAPPPFASPVHFGRQAYSHPAYTSFRRQDGPELALPLSALPALARDQALPPRRVLILTTRCVLALTFCSLEEIYKKVATRLLREVEARALFAPRLASSALAGPQTRKDLQPEGGSPRDIASSCVTFFKKKTAQVNATEQAIFAAVVAAVDSRGREGDAGRETSREAWTMRPSTAATFPVEQRMQRIQTQLLARHRQEAERSQAGYRPTYAPGGWTPDPRWGVHTPYGGGQTAGPDGGPRGWARLFDCGKPAFFGAGGVGGVPGPSVPGGNVQEGKFAAGANDVHAFRHGCPFLEELFLAYLRDVYTPEQFAAVCWQLLIDFPAFLAPSLSAVSSSSCARDLHYALRALLHASEAHEASLAGLTTHAGLLFHVAPGLTAPSVSLPFTSRRDREFLDLFLHSTKTLSTLPPTASPLVLDSLRRGDGVQDSSDEGRRVRLDGPHAVEQFLTPLRRGYVGGAQSRGEDTAGGRGGLATTAETGLRFCDPSQEGRVRDAGNLAVSGGRAHAFAGSGSGVQKGVLRSAPSVFASSFSPVFEDESEGRAPRVAAPSLSPAEIPALLLLSWRALVGAKETPRPAGASRSAGWGSADHEADCAKLKELENELQQLRQRNACDRLDKRRERGDSGVGRSRFGDSSGPSRWLLGSDAETPRPGGSLQEQQLELQIKQLQLQIEQRAYQQQVQLSTSAAPSPSVDPFSLSPTAKGLLLFVSRLLRPLLFAPLFEAGHSPAGIVRAPSSAAAATPAADGGLRRRSRLAFLFGDGTREGTSGAEASLHAVAGLAGVQAGQLAPGGLPVPICMRGRFPLAAVSVVQRKLALLFMVIDAVYTAIFQRHVQQRQEQIAASQASPTSPFVSFSPIFPPAMPQSLPPHYPLPAFSASLAGYARDARPTEGGVWASEGREEKKYADAVASASRAAIVWGTLPSHDQEELQQLFSVSRMLLLCNEALAAYRLLLREMASCAQLGRRRVVDALQFDKVLCLNLSLLCSERSSREDFRQFVFSCVSVQSPALAQLCTGGLFTPQELRAHSALVQLKSFIEDAREAMQQEVFQQKLHLSRFLEQAEQPGSLVSSLPSLPAPSPAVHTLHSQIEQFVDSQLAPLLFFFPIGRLAELLVSVQMYGEEACHAHVTGLLQRFLALHLEARERQRTGAQSGDSRVASLQGDDAEALFWRMQAASLVGAVLTCDDERLQQAVFSWIAQAGQKTFPESLLTLRSPYLLPWIQQHFRHFALDLGAFYAAAGLSSRAAAEYLAQGLRPWGGRDSSAPSDASLSPRSREGDGGRTSPQNAETGKVSGAQDASAREGDSDEAAKDHTAQLLAFDAARDAFCVESTARIWQRTAAHVSQQSRAPSLQERLVLLAQAKDALQQQTQEMEAQEELLRSSRLEDTPPSGDGHAESRHLRPSVGDARAAWFSAQAVAERTQSTLSPLLVGCVSVEQISESMQMVGYQQGLLRDCLRVFCFLTVEYASAAARVKSLAMSASRRCGPSLRSSEEDEKGNPFATEQDPKEERAERDERERLFREAVEDFLEAFFAHREQTVSGVPAGSGDTRTSTGSRTTQNTEEWDIFGSLLDLMIALQTTVYSRAELLSLVAFFWKSNRRVRDGTFSSIFPSITCLQLLASASTHRQSDRLSSRGSLLDAREKDRDDRLLSEASDANAVEDGRVAAACASYLAFATAASRVLENEKILHTSLDDLLSYPDVGLRRAQRRLLPEYLVLLHKFVKERGVSESFRPSASAEGLAGGEAQRRFLEEILLRPSCRVGGDDGCTESLLLPPALWPAWMILHRRVSPGRLVDAYLHLIRDGSQILAVEMGVTPQVQATIFAWLFDAWLMNEENSTSGATFIKTFSFYLSEGKLPSFETPNECLHAQLNREEREGAIDACRNLTRLVLNIGAALAAAALEVPQLKQLEMYRSACNALDTFQSKLSLYADALRHPTDD